jgi:hypothetical protein
MRTRGQDFARVKVVLNIADDTSTDIHVARKLLGSWWVGAAINFPQIATFKCL